MKRQLFALVMIAALAGWAGGQANTRWRDQDLDSGGTTLARVNVNSGDPYINFGATKFGFTADDDFGTPDFYIGMGAAATSDFMWPQIGAADAVTTSGDNVLLCQRVYLPVFLDVDNIYVRGVVGTDSGTDDTLAVAVYADAAAGTRLITTGAGSDLTTTANVTFNVTDTQLGPGMYRLCGCAQDVSGASFHAATLDDETIDVMNVANVMFGTAANSCVAGVPPTTTGALSTADDNMPVIKLGQ